MSAANEEEGNPFTSFYAQLFHQGNMLQDHVRTATYQQAMLQNRANFHNKIVLDVGTGTGILSFFALQAGAKLVYAIDASDSVIIAKRLAAANGYDENQIIVVKGKVEEVELPGLDKLGGYVDVIISEPIGFLLVHERMLESYVVARERFLHPTKGVMFPSTGSIVLAQLSDDAAYQEQIAKIAFWDNDDFYGVKLGSVRGLASQEYFSQAIVGVVNPQTLMSSHRTVHSIDFSEVTVGTLQSFEIPFSFVADRTALMHGLAGWFDLSFDGADVRMPLSTAPECPTTHWYQCKLLFPEPMAVNRGQTVSGLMSFEANSSFSYFIDIVAQLEGTSVVRKNRINLKDQQYSYLSPES
jgi:histone-arginine methyltransferase CARM1